MAVSAVPVRDTVKECYDPQCNCPNKKEMVLHNQHISRLPRIELENRFLHVYEDNIRLKTDCNHLRDQLKRLSTRVFRLIESRKSLPLKGSGGFERQALNAEMLLSEQAQHIASLEAENEIWRAKVEAMRQQFLSCRSFTNCRSKNSKKIGSSRHEQWYLEEEIERLKENLQKMERTVSILRNGGDPDDSSTSGSAEKRKGKGKGKGNQSPHRGELNNKTDLEEQRARVDSDVELIKARRIIMAQAQQTTALKEQVTKIEQELAEKQKELEEKMHNCDELSEQVKKNNDKIAELQHEITDLRLYEQKVKDLAEQIRDLKLERDDLKAHNSQLLQLSTAAIGSSRSVASEDSFHITGESLAALQQRVTSLESALGAEKAERLTVEASKEAERLQIAQLHQQNEELTVHQKELEERLQVEQVTSANAAAYKTEAEDLRAVKTELESKCQMLEDKLKEREEPCSRCLQLEKELEAAKLQEEKPLEEIYNFANLEEENSVVDLLRKFRRFREQGGPSALVDFPPDRGDIPTRRYPTLDQTRHILGFQISKHGEDQNTIPSSEAGQGDHQRNSSKHAQAGTEGFHPSASASSASIPTNASNFSQSVSTEKVGAANSTGAQSMNDANLLLKDLEPDPLVAQTAQMGSEGKYLETVRELEKCQELLRVQQNINTLYRNEIDALAKEILQHTGKYMTSQDI